MYDPDYAQKDELNRLCVGNSSVLDVKDNVLYRSNIGFPGVIGHHVFSEYLFNTLRVAPAKGSKKATLTPTEPVLTRADPGGTLRRLPGQSGCGNQLGFCTGEIKRSQTSGVTDQRLAKAYVRQRTDAAGSAL